MSEKEPLGPRKGKVSLLISTPRCAEQSGSGACHVTCLWCVLSSAGLVSQVFCLSPSRCLLETLDVILSISALCVPRSGAGTAGPLTCELGGASELRLSLEASSRTSFPVLF